MVITFVISHTRLIIILDDLCIGGIDNMTSISSQYALILKLMSSLRKAGCEFIEKIFESVVRDLIATLNESRL